MDSLFDFEYNDDVLDPDRSRYAKILTGAPVLLDPSVHTSDQPILFDFDW
ncbi:MAG: hypothetical protein ACFCVC_17435 [Acidimicrobiia bacterium]